MEVRGALYLSLSLLFLVWFTGMLLPSVPQTYAAKNQTVLTKANVSNTNPYVENVTVSPPSGITLVPGTTIPVQCNATVSDYNGMPNDVFNVTAILYWNGTGDIGPIKNDTAYLSNCSNVSTINTASAQYTCNFSIWYFARNGTWVCNVTAIDNGRLNGTASNSSYIDPLIAINVSDVLDYGEVQSLNVSNEQTVNISNFGNFPLNISVRGWGGQNETMYPNESMICEYGGNIHADMQRYNITSGQAWATGMTNLTGEDAIIRGLQVIPKTDTNPGMNRTYWKIKIPAGVGGLCNGTLLFTASNYN